MNGTPGSPARDAASRRRRRLGTAAAAFVATLVLAETVARIALASGVAQAEEHALGLKQLDPRLGYRAKPDAVVEARKRLGDEELFSVTYRIDGLGRRLTPVDPGGGPRERFALFLGDSFTFGYGLEDGETLPAQFSRAAPSYQPYNLALPAWGPQHALVLLKSGEASQGVAEPDGVALFGFVDVQARRAIGSTHVMAWDGGRGSPCFELRGGVLVDRGSFESARPFTTFVRRLLSSSHLLRAAEVDWPAPDEDDLELVARILSAARDEFEARHPAREPASGTPGERFHVLILPGSRLAPRLATHLERAGLSVLDYSSWDDPDANDRIPGDGHPTARANAALAARLARELSR